MTDQRPNASRAQTMGPVGGVNTAGRRSPPRLRQYNNVIHSNVQNNTHNNPVRFSVLVIESSFADDLPQPNPAVVADTNTGGSQLRRLSQIRQAVVARAAEDGKGPYSAFARWQGEGLGDAPWHPLGLEDDHAASLRARMKWY